ncbi:MULTISPECIES: glycosyltransferase [unclassified Marinobacter]|jgi:glycosyltransferase involved in cell wall biosynthesis|uniref:glycosyltransferase n=1 Tax=unclassified Marinobacter TaxID=83889 RepID=UPI00200EBF33|nr:MULTISPECIES: glycosyltransferase [unclassified Marinobacter]UQG54159.1 glycosyltransferase [Marinobacter sp. M4C]UQG62966.1 glycosyltransferase [Marinobacter sp. M2C]UQG67244.1 glycosyltransferase [Marinobacter sp. M1C]
MSEQKKAPYASPYFSIVIPAYNEEDHIGSCLQAIFDSKYDSEQYEVIVVDNGSHDRTREIALNSDRARIFQLLEGNVGAVRNYGAKQSRGQILIFIDADCIMDNNWLNRAEKLIKDRPNCAYGGGAKLPSNATWIETSWLLENKGQPTLPKHLIGASTMLAKELFLSTDGFDELVSAGEDTDLHNRLIFRHVPVLIDHSLDITHLGNAKTALQFIRRQIWHSENYMRDIKGSITDPTFDLILAFTILVPTTAAIAPFNSKLSLLIALTTAFIPLLFSVKRVIRSKNFAHLKNFRKIYFLDLLYVFGRSLGLLKGLYNSLRHPAYQNL